MYVTVLPSWTKKLYTKKRHSKGPAFDSTKLYKVFGYDNDGQSNGFVILVNDYNEIWWVSNRHVRVAKTICSINKKDKVTDR